MCSSDLFQQPCLLQKPRKRGILLPPMSHTPATLLATPSTTLDNPRSQSTPLFPPEYPSSPQLDCERLVLLPLPRFDWADDAASLPTAPSNLPRDISSLKTDRSWPFGNLRRWTRRRAPPQFYSSRKKFRSAVPSLIPPQPFITRRHPSGIGPGKPTITVPFETPAPAPALKLDWDQDPRLADLSRALQALGWTPPS